MFDMLTGKYKNLASKGRYGDTMLAHINPQEAALLKSMGGAGTINPQTGLREFYGISQAKALGLIPEPYQAPYGTYDMRGASPAAPAPFDRAFADVNQLGMGVQQVTGYTVPSDEKFADIPLVTKYDPEGNFVNLTLEPGKFLTPDPNQPNIISVPRLNASGEVVDWGIVDTNNQDDGGLGSFVSGLVEDFGPMIAAAIGANLLAPAAGAAGGAAGAAGALSPYAAQAAGAYGGSAAAAGAAAAGSLAGIEAASAAQNALTQQALTGTGLTFGQGVTPTPSTPTPSTPTPSTPTPPAPDKVAGMPASEVTQLPPEVAAETTASASDIAANDALAKANQVAQAAGGFTPAATTGLLSSLGSIGSSALDFAKANPSIAGSLLGAVTGAIGASNAPKEQTATTSIDPQIKAEYLANLERAKTTAAGLTARQFEGFTPSYLLAEAQAQNLGLGGIGQQTTNEATRLAMIEAGFTPQQIQAATAGNASLAKAQGYTAQQMAAAQANRKNVANVQSGAGSKYMAAYQNPYEEQVVQGALGDIERARLMQEQSNRAQATSARAFGGSRQGVVSGMTNEAALRQAATTAGQLRSAGFTQAAQLGQTDAARQLQAQLANQGIDVTLEQANAQLRQQGLLSNQAASNQAAQFGAGATNQANLTNALALNQMAQYNAQLAQQAALANQGAYAQGAGIRQAAIGQLGQLGAQQQNLGLTGANAVMEAQMRQQALLQARLDAARNLGTERLAITGGALGLQPANVGQTSTQPLYSSTAGSLLSGGLTGAYIGSLLGK